MGWLNLVSSLQSTNDSVLAVGFSPRDSSCIVTSGKSHVHFWNWSGGTGVPGNGTLTRKQGVFGVRRGWVQRGAGGQSGGGSVGLSTVDPNTTQLATVCDFQRPFPLTPALCSPLPQKYKKPKFIPCFVFLPDGDILTGDSEGNILTWGRSLSDSRTPGRGGAKGMWLGVMVSGKSSTPEGLWERRRGFSFFFFFFFTVTVSDSASINQYFS